MTHVTVPSYRQRSAYHAAALGGTALLVSAVLAIGDLQTREEIQLRLAEDLEASLTQVVPGDLHANNLLEDPLLLTLGDASDEQKVVYRGISGERVAALAYAMAAPGYGGEIRVMLGVDATGRVLGVRVLEHRETPGLGDKIELRKSDWIRKFNGRALGDPPLAHWKVKKDGGDFDQFTGATITPRAVVRAVREGLQLHAKQRAALLALPVKPVISADEVKEEKL